MRDRGGFVCGENIRIVNVRTTTGVEVGWQYVGGRIRVGKGSREVVDVGELRFADADHLARRQDAISRDQFVSYGRAIAAIQVANDPIAVGQEHFGMAAAATFVLEHDLVGRRTTDRDRLSRNKPEHVGPFRAFADDEIR